MIIAIEGIDGSGKSTQAKLLYERMTERSIPSRIFHPFDDIEGGLGQDIRLLLKTYNHSPQIQGLIMAFVHARVKAEVGGKEGGIVILDRSTPSFFAYQKSFFRSPDGQKLRKLFDPLLGHPDHVYLLDIDAEQAMARVNSRETSTTDNFNTLTFQKLVRSEYLNQATLDPDRYTVIHANCAPSEVSDAIFNHFDSIRTA